MPSRITSGSAVKTIPLVWQDALVWLGRSTQFSERQSSNEPAIRRMMDKYGLARAQLLSFTAPELEVPRGNETVLAAAERNPRLVPCPAVLPNSSFETGEEAKYVDGLIARGARTVCYYPVTFKSGFDRRIVGRLMAALQRRRLPLLLFETATLEAVRLAETYPRLPVLLAAVDDRDRTWLPLYRATRNLHFVLAPSFSLAGGLEWLVRAGGADRLLFGSAYPVMEPGGHLMQLLYADLSEADRRKIAGVNLERLWTGVTGVKRLVRRADPVPSRAASGLMRYIWTRRPLPLAGIVDMHAHIGNYKHFALAKPDPERVVADMDRTGIERIFIAHHMCMGTDVTWGNDQVLAGIRRFPKRIMGYAVCHPANEALGIGEVRRAIRAGMRGIKLHVGNGCAYTHPGYVPVWEFADRHRLPVLLHTWGDLEKLEPLFKKYRHAQILLGHSGSLNPEQYVAFVRRFRNLWLELCCSRVPNGLVEYFVRQAGARRILFGSDIPWISPAQQLGRVVCADISESDRRAILVDNARRVLDAIRL